MPRDVRTHTRRAASGKTTTVNHHTRRGSSAGPQKPKRKRGPNPGHAGKLGRRARSAVRKGRKGKATMLVALAGLEVGAWLTLSGTSFVLALAAGVLAFISIVLAR
jgi:hypothetical protein